VIGLDIFMKRTWHKAMAVLLLAWVFLDVAVPGVCPEDGFAIVGSQIELNIVRFTTSSHPSNRPLATDDACFCYCAHMILGTHFSLDASVLAVPIEAQPLYAALEGPPHSLYHPPRS